ncbi:MAG: TolC family protein, partial [Deltaproteobacteria bacterium]|nr:TolC family protein [Deltaproteobacteria bacterium]
MKRIQIILFSFVLIIGTGMNGFALSTDSPEEKKWSLSDLYQRALDFSETIKIAEKELIVAEKDKDRAFAVLVPRFTAYGGYKRYQEDKIEIPESAWSYGARFDQSFTLNGKELIALGMAEDQIAKTGMDLNDLREFILFQVAAGYFDILKAIKRKEIAQTNVSRMETHKDAVLVQLKLENAPKTELYRTEATLSGYKTELVIAENNVFLSRARLMRLVDLPENFRIRVPETLSEGMVEHNIEELKQSALSDREDLKSLKMSQKISESNIRFSKGAYWPTLSIEGGYEAMESKPDFFTLDEDMLFVGAKVSFPLYDGGLRSAELGQARVRSKQAELKVKDRSKKVSLEVETAYRNLITIESLIASVNDKLKSAEANYEAIMIQFKTGMADSLDVIDANALLADAERELIEAKYRLSLTFLKLQKARGIFLSNITEKYNLKM